MAAVEDHHESPQSTPTAPAPGGSETDRTASVRSLVGLLAAGFTAAVNFVGLRSAELSTVLRNEPSSSAGLALLVAVGMALAATSVFVSAKRNVSWVWAAAACTALMTTLAIIVLTLRGNGASRAELWIGCALLVVSIAIAISLFWPRLRLRLRLRAESPITAQGLLVITAIVLTLIAAWTALRLETFSQRDATAVRLTPSVTETGSASVLKLGIEASKLGHHDRARVTVWGFSALTDLASFCHDTNAGILRRFPKAHLSDYPACPDNPCYDALYLARYGSGTPVPGCDSLSLGTYLPDDKGSIQQQLVLTTSTAKYARVEVVGQLCKAKTAHLCILDGDKPPAFVAIAL